MSESAQTPIIEGESATAANGRDERRIRRRRRILLVIAVLSTIGCGLFDWVTEPHDIVITKLKVVDGAIVEVDGEPVATASHSRPNSFSNRLMLTILNGVLGGLLITLVAWGFLLFCYRPEGNVNQPNEGNST